MRAIAIRAGWRSVGVLLLAGCWLGPLFGAESFEGETIVFGGDVSYPPFEWSDAGKPRGFHIDLEDAIAEAGGAKAEHRLSDWPDAVRALESGAVDVLPMFRSEQREKEFLFSPPLHYLNHGIYARDGGARVSSLDELAGHRVAIEELSYADQTLQELGFPAELVRTSNTLTALEAVADGRADYAILAAPTANHLIRQHGMPLQNMGPPLWPREYAMAVRRDRPELAAWLTEQLYMALRDGTYQGIYSRWESSLAPSEESALRKGLRLAAIPVAAIAFLGLLWVFRLRGVVASRTRHLQEESARRSEAESEAEWASTHDAQTRLPRLDHFSSSVETILGSIDAGSSAEKQIVALKLADLERTIRTLGHETALNMLREFAGWLRSMEFDAIGQTGRDVFLIFADAGFIAESFRNRVSPTDTVILEGAMIPSTVAGVATWPEHGTTLTELLRRAETALAVAIERRESWVEYRPSMEPDKDDLRLLEIFRKTPGQGIYAQFQPQIDIASGAIVAAEALARWNAPGVGLVSPGKFVPLLEDAGLIRYVTRHMLREAIALGVKLRQAGYECPISVNVAVADMLGDRTRKAIFEMLREHGGNPADLKLELTETSVADSPETIFWVISRLRESGIRTSIDDFGTGYSSLAYLSGFPVDEVKIDKSFVDGMTSRAQDASIVRSTIAMAHELDLQVVAEGVETGEQLEMLREAGCDCSQGFLFSKPVAAERLLELLAADSNREATIRLKARRA